MIVRGCEPKESLALGIPTLKPFGQPHRVHLQHLLEFDSTFSRFMCKHPQDTCYRRIIEYLIFIFLYFSLDHITIYRCNVIDSMYGINKEDKVFLS